jgi:hypothetical protein
LRDQQPVFTYDTLSIGEAGREAKTILSKAFPIGCYSSGLDFLERKKAQVVS